MKLKIFRKRRAVDARFEEQAADQAASPGVDPAAEQAVGAGVFSESARIEEIARQCRRLATKRALLGAGVAIVPVPGLDWATDVGILTRLIPDISRAFGLTPQQIERLSPDHRMVVYKTLTVGGGLLIGRLVTRELLMEVLKRVGVRLTVQQAAKYVPMVGQAASALLTFSALKYVCEQHIRQCMAVSRQLMLPPPVGLESN